MSSSQGRYQVGATGRWSGTITSEAGARIPLADIQSATVTLTDERDGSVINSRSAQDIIGGVGGSGVNNFDFADDSTDTTIGWDIQTADLALSGSPSVGEALAEILITATISGETKILREDHRLRIVDAPGICTYDDVENQVQGMTESTWRILVEDAIEAVGRQAEKIAQRRLRKSTAASPTTQVLSIGERQRAIYLNRYPIDSITSVKESADGDFSDVDAMDSSDYYLDSAKGTLELRFRNWIPGPGTVQVVYAGGMFSGTGGVDADLRFAAARQVAFWWQQRDQLGLEAISIPGASVQVFSRGALLPIFRDTCKSLRRLRL